MTDQAEPDFLVTTQWLEDHLSDPALRLFDATAGQSTAAGGEPQPARAAFEKVHIPGARYLDLKSLSDPDSSLDFTRLDPERAVATFAEAGVGSGTFVVVYSTSSYGWATRIWWLLNDLGFTRVAVLDGCLTKWAKEGRATAAGIEPAYSPAPVFSPKPSGLFVDLPDVLDISKQGGSTLVNALSSDLFSGVVAGPHGRKGHIPGSISIPAASLVEPADNSIKPLKTLKQTFAVRGITDNSQVVTYCGSGIAATVDAFLLRAIGHQNVRVYDGSLSEWSQDPERPLDVIVPAP